MPVKPHYCWSLLCSSLWESQQHKHLSLHNLHLCLCFASFIKSYRRVKGHAIRQEEIKCLRTTLFPLCFKTASREGAKVIHQTLPHLHSKPRSVRRHQHPGLYLLLGHILKLERPRVKITDVRKEAYVPLLKATRTARS